MALAKQGRTQSQGASANFSRAVGEFRDSVHLLALARKRESAKMVPTSASIPKRLLTSPFPSSRLFIISK